MLLGRKQNIGNYTVTFPIKQGTYAETYRVKDASGKNFFLKLINCSKLRSDQFSDDGEIMEAKVAKHLRHPNLVRFHDNGNIIIEGGKYTYLVFDYISGETLGERLNRDNDITIYEAKSITVGVLNGMKYLHSLDNPIIHNEITPENIMLDMSGEMPVAKLIDFGHALFLNGEARPFNPSGLNPFYMSSELLNGIYTTQSDIFAVGAVLYKMVYGRPPYFADISDYQKTKVSVSAAMEDLRKKPLRFPETNKFELDSQLINVMAKALAVNVDDRFKSSDEFIKALEGEVLIDTLSGKRKVKGGGDENEKPIPQGPAKGKGFSAIAGMQELKDMMQKEIIDALHHPDEFAKYGLTIPNGMLLYGPPGCGKTFFAKHFAEEVGFNYMEIKPSTLKSRWVNATQENIGKMFQEAEKNAPTIIFIDEMNELVPNRDSGDVHEMSRSAVNEMLAQMDRTGEKGIFIIGATNYPNMIDPAILRAGRLDKKYYIGPPDKEAREKMFELYLKDRPYDFGIDYARLSELTNGYVSADLKLIVDDASRKALFARSKITQKLLEDTIANTKPSISKNELRKYDRIKAMMDGDTSKVNERPHIGFN